MDTSRLQQAYRFWDSSITRLVAGNRPKTGPRGLRKWVEFLPDKFVNPTRSFVRSSRRDWGFTFQIYPKANTLLEGWV
jgi:hypothetical protein